MPRHAAGGPLPTLERLVPPVAQRAQVTRAGARSFATVLSPGLVLIAALIACIPAWKAVWYQSDLLPSVFRTLHTDLAHHHGVLFPRIACELGFGYGQLLHQVYAPLGFELTAWLHALGLGYITSMRAFFSLCLVAGAFGAYAYGRAILADRAGAVLAAIAHVWAPYVLLDAHPGGDFGESLAIALLPWSLLTLHRLIERRSWSRLGLAALGLAAVPLAHNVTALFFAGLVCVYLAVLAARVAIQRGALTAAATVARGGVALGLGLAVSAIYWAPAFFELSYSRMNEQREGSFSVSAYLVSAADLLQRTPVFSYDLADQGRFGLVAFLLTVLSLALLGAAWWRHRVDSASFAAEPRAQADLLVLAGFGVLFLSVLLMQLRLAQPIWDSIPLVSFVQFPRRLDLFATLASAMLIGSLPGSLRQLGVRRMSRLAGVGLVAALTAVAGLPGIYAPPAVPPSHLLTEDQVSIGSAADRRFSQRSAYDDFFPAWVTERQVDIPRPPASPELYRAASDLPAPHVQVLEREYRELRLISDADTTSGLVLHRFYFPGWRATVDGQPTTVAPVSPLGLTRVEVPPGRHDVVVTFGETPLRVAADAISVGAGLLVLMIVGRGLGTRRTIVGVAAVAALLVMPWTAHLAASHPVASRIAPLDVGVTESARIVGVEQGQQAYVPGETVRVTVLWQATAWTAADLQSGLRLVSLDDDQPLAEHWDRPNLGRTPTAKWVLGELVPDDFSLRVPPGTPPGRYRLLAGLRGSQASALVPVGEIDVR